MSRAPVILLLFIAGVAPVSATELPWSEADYKASKLFMTIRLNMGLALLSGDELTAVTTPAFEGEAIMPGGDTVARVTLRSRRSDQTKETQLYFDPDTGAALRREQRERSKKPDFKDLRYTTTGIARTRAEPLKGETDRPPGEWGQVRQQFRAFPPLDEGSVVADAAALPFLIATRDWSGPGDRFELLIFEDRQLVRVTATAVRWNETRVDFRTDEGKVDGRQRLLEIRVLAIAPEQGGKADIDLFGLSSDVLLLFDTRRRVPAEIRGSVAFLGEVRFGLKQVRRAPAAD